MLAAPLRSTLFASLREYAMLKSCLRLIPISLNQLRMKSKSMQKPLLRLHAVSRQPMRDELLLAMMFGF